MEKGLWCVCACVCTCSWDFEECGEVGVWRAGGRVQNVLSCGAGRRQLLSSVPFLFWGNQDAEARELGEQICWDQQTLGERQAASGRRGFLFGMAMRVLCDCGSKLPLSGLSRLFGPTDGELWTRSAGTFFSPVSGSNVGPSLRQDNSIFGDQGFRGRCQVLRDVVTRSPGGPWAPPASTISFCFLLTDILTVLGTRS